jgi:hypothetical protein
MMLRVTSVQPLEGYRLRVAFSDGVERDVDCGFLLHGTLGESLRDPEYFRRVRVDDEARTVVWPTALILRRSFYMASASQRFLRKRAPNARSEPGRLAVSGRRLAQTHRARTVSSAPIPPAC